MRSFFQTWIVSPGWPSLENILPKLKTVLPNADFVIEGYVDPRDPLRGEGPFGDHTGYYTLPEPYPVFHVAAITHRKDAVYPATIVGIPPMEDFYIGGAALTRPAGHPLPSEGRGAGGGGLNFPRSWTSRCGEHTRPRVSCLAPSPNTLLRVRLLHSSSQRGRRLVQPGAAALPYKIMHGLWGLWQMMFTKYLVVVDDDVNVHNTSEVLFRLCANTDPQRDSIFTKGPSDVLDHATSEIAIGSKPGLDATKKLPGEGGKTFRLKSIEPMPSVSQSKIVAEVNAVGFEFLPSHLPEQEGVIKSG